MRLRREPGTPSRAVSTLVSVALATAAVAGILHHHGAPCGSSDGTAIRLPGSSAATPVSGPCLVCRVAHDQLPAVEAPRPFGTLDAARDRIPIDAANLPSAPVLLVERGRAPPIGLS